MEHISWKICGWPLSVARFAFSAAAAAVCVCVLSPRHWFSAGKRYKWHKESLSAVCPQIRCEFSFYLLNEPYNICLPCKHLLLFDNNAEICFGLVWILIYNRPNNLCLIFLTTLNCHWISCECFFCERKLDSNGSTADFNRHFYTIWQRHLLYECPILWPTFMRL